VADWVLGAGLVDAILLLVILEASVLAFLHQRRGLGPAPGRLLPNLAAGFCLLLALRLALAEARGVAVAAALAAALVAHVVDLMLRWRDGAP
jgi:hypothetical protein